jgi:hypothetical protein
VPRTIDTSFVLPGPDAVHNALLRGLGVLDPVNGYKRCKDYLSEKPAVAVQRRSLALQKENVERIRNDLSEFNAQVNALPPVAANRSTQSST